MSRLAPAIWTLLLVLIWGSVFTLFFFLPSTLGVFRWFLETHPVAAPFALVLVQILFATLVFPCSPLTFSAGVLWGLETGLVYSILATVAASTMTFLISRNVFLGSSRIRNISEKHLTSVHNLISKYSWLSVAVAYANPVFPGSSLGYIFGLSEISLGTFVCGVFIGTIPSQIVIIYGGHIFAKLILDLANLTDIALLSLALLCLVLLRRGIQQVR